MDDEPLVRAMPRRPLYGLDGLIQRIDLAVLDAVSDECWYATRSAIAADVDSKEVRLGVMVVRPGQVREALVAAGGVLTHPRDLGPELGSLATLKAAARAAAEEILGAAVTGVELVGYLNDDRDPAMRRVFLLVYRTYAAPGAAAPAGAAWVRTDELARAGLDAVSVRTAPAAG